MGDVKQFKLKGAEHDIEYVSKVTIDLKSYLGDADLFVATSNFGWPNTEQY